MRPHQRTATGRTGLRAAARALAGVSAALAVAALAGCGAPDRFYGAAFEALRTREAIASPAERAPTAPPPQTRSQYEVERSRALARDGA